MAEDGVEIECIYIRTHMENLNYYGKYICTSSTYSYVTVCPLRGEYIWQDQRGGEGRGGEGAGRWVWQESLLNLGGDKRSKVPGIVR